MTSISLLGMHHIYSLLSNGALETTKYFYLRIVQTFHLTLHVKYMCSRQSMVCKRGYRGGVGFIHPPPMFFSICSLNGFR